MRATDKIISFDAAKLLGLPFTWGRAEYACKFLPTDEGPRLMTRGITDYGVRYYGGEWVPTDNNAVAVVEDLEDGHGNYTLYLVEEDPDASDR